jgi:hypothetical protein
MSDRVSKTERAEAQAKLREWLKPGDTVHTTLRHVSRSGMQRTIELVICAPRIEHDETRTVPYAIGWAVARALDRRFDRDRGGVKIGGCGMDMGFALVYELGRALWPDGVPCVGERCQSNDHSNGDYDYTPHTNGGKRPYEVGYVAHWHKDGGYALRQAWL